MDAGSSRIESWAVAAVFALLFALAFPFRAGPVWFDAGAVAGWVAVGAFAWGIRNRTPASAFRWGVGAGTLGFSVVLFWIFVVVTVHGHAAAPIGVLAVVGLAFYCGLHLGMAAALTRVLEPAAGAMAVFVLPAAWVVTEHLRTFDLFSGFPWGYLGYAVHSDGPVLALASVGGVYGLSFLLAVVGNLLARGRWTAAGGVVAAAHVVGFALGIGTLPEGGAEIRAGVVQANIPQGEKWDPARATSAFESHLELSRFAGGAGVDLILWPESAMPFVLESEPAALDALQQLARETGASIVIGGMAVERDAAGEVRFFNSAYALAPDGALGDRHDKSVLVPFGEYVPLGRALSFISAVATGLAGVAQVTPGDGAGPIGGLALPDSHAAAPLICYEVIYPTVVRQAVRGGARVLLNLTNDAWYGRTSAPHQFLAIAAMRSAEHGVPMLRAANTGVSAVVDSSGRVRAETRIFEGAALVEKIPPAKKRRTLYTRFGDWVVWGSWALLIGIGGRRVVGRWKLG